MVVVELSTPPDAPFISSSPPLRLSGTNSLRCIVGAALNASVRGYSFSHYTASLPPVLGVMNEPSDRAIAVNDGPKSFSDFDLYTMQRHIQDLDAFLQWKSEQAYAPRIAVDDILGLKPHAFEKKEFTLSFRLPLEDPPAGTLTDIIGPCRDRQSEVDSLLDDDECHLRFRVSEVMLPHDPNVPQVSQQYLGYLECDENVSTTQRKMARVTKTCPTRIRLTLFDERFFTIPPDQDFRDQCEPEGKMVGLLPELRVKGYLAFAADSMRREHAAYDRLRSLQGTLLPYCYGFHQVCSITIICFVYILISLYLQFQLPTGHEVYGFFTEDVQGSPLPDAETFTNVALQLRLVRLTP